MTDTHPDDADQKAPVPLISAALFYGSIGLKVFPLSPGTKIPFKGSGGLRDATTDPDMIRSWWEGNPAANIGIATGHMFDVLDVDGPIGVRSYLDIVDTLPTIYGAVSTPRPGGSHYYLAARPGTSNKAALLPGIDFRAGGGYVLAPPSVITEGPNPGAYRWRGPLNIDGLRKVAA